MPLENDGRARLDSRAMMSAGQQAKRKKDNSGRRMLGMMFGVLACFATLGTIALYTIPQVSGRSDAVDRRHQPTHLGVNLFGVASYNRQQVFTNLILQSEWMSSEGAGWRDMPSEQLDDHGWILFLKPGQTAPRMLVLPPAPFRDMEVKCFFTGKGLIDAGGVATVRDRFAQSITLDLRPTGKVDEVAWLEIAETDPKDPIRNIDCRETEHLESGRFHPEFLSFVGEFKTIRFLDWQRVNDNAPVNWQGRPLPLSATQAGPGGVSIEDMVDVANQAKADPWFLMPYSADQAYIRQFARLVHDRIDSERTVYVELGNEVWNSMFAASAQAQREGLSLGLGNGDPMKALMLRYAQKVRQTMQIWTAEFADRPERLVRVAASQNAWPDLASIVLESEDTARWIDALATAPYFGFDLAGQTSKTLDRVFATMPNAIDEALDKAVEHQDIATRHGKVYLAYEGGQHFVTHDIDLAHALQRDPRMGEAYISYLSQWDARIGGGMMLYASTAPIAHYGSWGLREYAGQPLPQAPKLRAVRQFLARAGDQNAATSAQIGHFEKSSTSDGGR